MLDINSLKLKKKNMAKKIENATSFIEEIDNHKKSIFEFWRYSNKDEVASLPEGEKEQINTIKKITRVFDYEEDIEKLGKAMDNLQRKVLSKSETDSIYIASTNLITILNQVKNNEIGPKEIEANLKELKKEAIQEKTLTQKDEFDIFGGITQDLSKISQIKNQRHREIAKDKFSILDINKNTKQIGYKLSLEKVIENLKMAMEKVVLLEDVPVYKATVDNELEEKNINLFDMNPETEIREILKQDKNQIYFYKFYLKKGTNGICLTNSIFYDNQNKTLPVGQDLSSKVLVDISKLNKQLKEENSFKIVDLEENNDFSKINIKTVHVIEYEV